MMSVVVEHAHRVTGKQLLLPPHRAREIRDSFANRQGRIAKLMQQRDDRDGVGNVLLTEQTDGEVAELHAAMRDGEAG